MYLVTGNAHKLEEWRRLFPANYQLEAVDIDLDEIQSLDLDEIIKDKAMRAYERIRKPVIVEDVSAGLEELHGLPGPFIKYFEKTLGRDALYQLAHTTEAHATITIIVAYYDGRDYTIAQGVVTGRAVPALGTNGFGFDLCFVPDGQTKTYAQMTPAEKDAVSHRSQAIKQLVHKLSRP